MERQRDGVQAKAELGRQGFVHRSRASEAALPVEGRRSHFYYVMSLTASGRTGVSGMLCAVVYDLQKQRIECSREPGLHPLCAGLSCHIAVIPIATAPTRDAPSPVAPLLPAMAAGAHKGE